MLHLIFKRICEVQVVTDLNVMISKFAGLTQKRKLPLASFLLLGGCLLAATPAQAHHPFGGGLPKTVLAGFLSGIGHPVIGIDHLVFVIAAGLLAVLQRRGIAIPVAFVLMSLVGTGIHLMRLDLPGSELVISASVLLFGVLLALKNRLNLMLVVGLGAIAGIFHGYAYGEAIVGAEMTPLVAYLAGFALIQLVISLSAYLIGKRVIEQGTEQSLPLRFAGCAICGIGMTLTNAILFG